MEGLCRYNPAWDDARAGVEGRVYKNEDVLIATDFEGGNGTDIRRLAVDHYVINLEPEPGQHGFSGTAYYYCFGIRNRKARPRTVRIRVQANWSGRDDFGTGVKHAVLRHGGAWSQLDPGAVHPVEGQPNELDLDMPLPGSTEADSVIFVSDFHWWPYGEVVAFLATLGQNARVREIGRSFQHRPIYAVEMGREGAPCMVHTATPQTSEMGHLCCKAMIDFLLSGDREAVAMLDAFRICFVPVTNPDGSVLGYGVSDAQGRFPSFEADLAAKGDPRATPERVAVWRYLEAQHPWLFWDWHSNHWSYRPGHMVFRYRPCLVKDATRRQLGESLGEKLLELPNTYQETWLSPTEDHRFGQRMNLYAIKQLGAVTHIIKQHDKYPIETSRQHAIACLRLAAEEYTKAMA